MGITHLWEFFFMSLLSVIPWSARRVWRLAFPFSLSFFFIFSLHQFLSFPGVGGAIVCLWLVYEEHWFAQWGLACSYREGGKSMNEFATRRPLHSHSTPSQNSFIFLPFYMLLGHLLSHFSTGVCICQRECISVKPGEQPTLARG